MNTIIALSNPVIREIKESKTGIDEIKKRQLKFLLTDAFYIGWYIINAP